MDLDETRIDLTIGRELARIARHLLESQEKLGDEEIRILRENVWELYDG